LEFRDVIYLPGFATSGEHVMSLHHACGDGLLEVLERREHQLPAG
jgi:hypothetical protein